MIRPMSNKEDKILDVLKKSELDLSIGEISERTNISRDTVSKYVSVLKAEGKIKLSRNVGNAKLYKLNE